MQSSIESKFYSWKCKREQCQEEFNLYTHQACFKCFKPVNSTSDGNQILNRLGIKVWQPVLPANNQALTPFDVEQEMHNSISKSLAENRQVRTKLSHKRDLSGSIYGLPLSKV